MGTFISLKIRKHYGLTYSALDGDGKKIGVPFKASDFPDKPTLKYLERKYRVNEVLRQPHKARVKNIIDLALLKQPNHSIKSLIAALEKEGIHTARRETATGMVYGLTYVDQKPGVSLTAVILANYIVQKACRKGAGMRNQFNHRQA